jgi:hypothetical protein
MPRFYFDTVVNREIAHDDAGLEFASLDEARQEAMRAAAEIAKDLAYKGISADIAVHIRVGGVESLATARSSVRLEEQPPQSN